MKKNIPLPHSLAYDFKLDVGKTTYMLRVQTENQKDYYLLQAAKLAPGMEWFFVSNKALKCALLELLLTYDEDEDE